MKPKREVEQAIRGRLRFTAGSTLRDRLRERVMQAMEESLKTPPPRHRSIAGRFALGNPVTRRLSAAAAVVLAILLVTLWVTQSTPAYALDQTVEALRSVRFLHLVGRNEAGRIKDERWIEIGENGWQVRYRQDNPPEDSSFIEDGKSTAVYYHRKKGIIIYDREDEQFQWVGDLGKVLENLRQHGKILKANDEYRGRPAHKVWWPALTAECYVDPQTKLPMTIGAMELSYEEPPAGTFDIVIPDGYAVLDKRPGAVADAPAWLQEIADRRQERTESLDLGARALLHGDYAEAARRFEQAIGSDSWARFWLGRAYYELGQYDLAIKSFTEFMDGVTSIGGEETIPYCNYARGLAFARLGMREQAEADLQACLPAMVRTLRIPSGGYMFEYADNPMIRYGQDEPGDQEMVVKMVNRLRIVTGRSFDYDPNLTPEQNEASIAAWEQWLRTDGRIRFTPDATLLPVVSEWVTSLGWGRKSSEQIASRFAPAWLHQTQGSIALLRIGFALYDAGRYQDALGVFGQMEESGRSQHARAVALIWQGHMLDLLGRREEAISMYGRVADMGIEHGEQIHAQYGLTYVPSPYARERMSIPFARVENMDAN